MEPLIWSIIQICARILLSTLFLGASAVVIKYVYEICKAKEMP
ncbi:MAG: hypothetical protein AABY22_10880 [Nanoarchaeota archaeon]